MAFVKNRLLHRFFLNGFGISVERLFCSTPFWWLRLGSTSTMTIIFENFGKCIFFLLNASLCVVRAQFTHSHTHVCLYSDKQNNKILDKNSQVV